MCDSVVAGLAAASALSKEDLAMTRLACRSSESGGADAYSACVSAQIARLEQSIPMPDLSALPEIDRRLLERACTGTASDGPAAYRRCVSSQLISLAGAPDLPDLSTLPAERRRAIELACRDSAGAAAYHTCMERRAKEARRAPARAPG